jgi:hypothetical protein
MKKNVLMKTSFKRSLCECGNLLERVATSQDGRALWGKTCRSCRGRTRYGVKKGTNCVECGFIPKVSAQLQIDHIDGNNQNNQISNLRTLCCNCHAFKSFSEKDLRFPAEENPFYGRKHTKKTLVKIKKARKSQGLKSKEIA